MISFVIYFCVVSFIMKSIKITRREKIYIRYNDKHTKSPPHVLKCDYYKNISKAEQSYLYMKMYVQVEPMFILSASWLMQIFIINYLIRVDIALVALFNFQQRGSG